VPFSLWSVRPTSRARALPRREGVLIRALAKRIIECTRRTALSPQRSNVAANTPLTFAPEVRRTSGNLRCAMEMQTNHEQDLLWYFGEGQSTFRHSSFGDVLERAQALAFDSEGQRIPRRSRDDWHTMPVSSSRREPSYTPDDGDLVRAAGISRRLRRLGPEEAMVLHVYYGDIGARWARTRPGRLFSLYGLTDAGQKWLTTVPAGDLRPDEQLGRFATGARKDTHGRALLLTMYAQAKRLLERAARSWEACNGQRKR